MMLQVMCAASSASKSCRDVYKSLQNAAAPGDNGTTQLYPLGIS